MHDDWIIRKYSDKDELNIVELLKTVFDNWHSLEYWNWKYKQNADGFFSDLILLADCNEKLIGHYTIVPARIKIGDKILLGSQSVDTATHPDFRRKGIFEVLAKETYSNAVKNNISVTYGFAAVGPSYHGFVKKLGWYHVCFLINNEMVIDAEIALERHFKGKLPRVFIKILASFLELRNKMKTMIKVPEDVSIKQISEFDERISDFWNVIAKDYDIIIVKDKKFFDWRLRSPDHKYVIFIAEKDEILLGYIILNESKESGKIVDLLASPGHDEVINYLVLRAIAYCKEKKKDMLRCVLPADHKYLGVLRKIGFIVSKTKMGFIVRLNVSNANLEKRLKTLESWYITDLDSDHV